LKTSTLFCLFVALTPVRQFGEMPTATVQNGQKAILAQNITKKMFI